MPKASAAESTEVFVPKDDQDVVRELSLIVADRLRRRWGGADRLDEICGYAVSATGKLLRPLLLIECALAVGGRVDHVLPAAVGAESGHVASLVHDDIIDQDDVRRGQLAVHRKFGTEDAVVAGDALIFDLFAGLAECRDAGATDDGVGSALRAVARAGVDTCRGQVLEAQVSAERSFSIDSYLKVVELKTAAFFRGACESGAILGGGTDSEIRALASYGEHLGRAFQIQDDLLAFIADDATTGKPGTSDLSNGRITAPVVLAHLHANAEDRRLIGNLLTGGDDPLAGLSALRNVVERTGGLLRASEMAHESVSQARLALEGIKPTPSRNRLVGYTAFVTSREE